jgi:isocitrate dehydrogenase
VIATLNLNGDYLSDALAAQVGGIGNAPRQHQLCQWPRGVEATHGTAPKYVIRTRSTCPGFVRRNDVPASRLTAADLIVKGMDGAIHEKRVTYDFARLWTALKN